MKAIMIGFGTVGQGVADLLAKHAERFAEKVGEPVELCGVLVRDTSKKRDIELPEGCLVTDDVDALFAKAKEAGAGMLIEVAGGLAPAESYFTRAIEAGLDIVTANKALIAARGGALYSFAQQHKRRIGIEATVAGGVPILQLLTSGPAGVTPTTIAGITNGTCHFIIRSMEKGLDYQDALQKAKEMGYAEADPTLDVSGRDSVEKLAIMATLAFGKAVDVDAIPCTGVEELTPEILRMVQEAGYAVRLLGYAKQLDDGTVVLRNGPMLVPARSALGRCPSDEMGIVIEGAALPRAYSGGSGAGRYPTAAAVVGDVLQVAQLAGSRPEAGPVNPWPLQDAGSLALAGPDQFMSRFCVAEGDGMRITSETDEATVRKQHEVVLPVVG